MRHLLLLIGMLILLFPSCQPSESSQDAPPTNALFTRMLPQQTGIHFTNQVEDGEQFNVLTYRNFYNGGGVAIGDINKDGLPDIYFTANMQPNKLFLNKGNWQFEDITEKAGVAGSKGWSTGVTMADVNGDGWLDIYVCNSGDIAGDNKENELFINNGELFAMGTNAQGETLSAVSFSEQAAAYHLNDTGFTTHASFFDYDLDGDLDCYILNNSFKDPDRIDIYKKTREEKDPLGGDKLFRNDGQVFTDVTEKSGIYNSPIGFGLGVSVSDLNGDMLPDIYISNDFWERDYLYLNQGDGTFAEKLTERISLCSVSSMGADIADLNNDGSYDVFTTDMLAADNYRLKAMTLFDPYHLEDLKYRASYHYQILQNCLQINNGSAQFQETAHLSGVAATDWSWGALVFDFDNDGWKDIFVANGIFHEIMYLDFTNFINDKEDVKKIVVEKGKFDWRDFVQYMPSNPLANFAFVNQSGKHAKHPDFPVFDNQARQLGLGEPGFSNGSAYGDLDNDGDLDLVVNNVNMPAFVYRNNASHHYLKIKLEGKDQNPFGVGAEVRIKAGGQQQVLQHFPSRGFESAVEPGLVFGLGKAATIDQLEVIWPDHSKQTLQHIQADQTITLSQQQAREKFEFTPPASKPLFENVTDKLIAGEHLHTENRYNDFDHERLLPRMLSSEGPPIITGDLNGDGLQDVVLGGAANDADKIFLQVAGKQPAFQSRADASWHAAMEEDKKLETTCGAIFDADGDGDNDLLLGAGGNEYQKGINNFLLRYYENDGAGNLTKVTAKTPPAAGNFSCILPHDIEGDGDLDLFIGARAVPGNYGLPPRSFLLRNEGNGQWSDITFKELGAVGMVTDGSWSDVDRDGDADLLIVGDWLPLLIFENDGSRLHLSNRQTSAPLSGWWTGIETADLDQDGDEDYILGNWGLNSKFRASSDKPLSLYVKDFDNNGKSEFILDWYPPGNEESYPFASKMDITAQLPHLKKSNLRFEDYAHKSYNSLLTEEERKGAITYRVNTLETGILWNEEGGLRWDPLPYAAQVAPAFGMVAEDLDGDGHRDIWLGGNFYGLKPEAGRHDSSRGVFLKGDGKGGFEYLSPAETGIFVDGQVRDAIVMRFENGVRLMITRNNAEAMIFEKVSNPAPLP